MLNLGTGKMTVGETITSPSLVPVPQPPPPQIQMAQQTHPPLDQVNATGVIPNSAQVVQGMQHEATVPNAGGVVRSNSNTHHPSSHPMAAKVNQEILTSLHFIKDIRRLEKYQRDFFLKVTPKTHFSNHTTFNFNPFIALRIFCKINNVYHILGKRVFNACSCTPGSSTHGHGMVRQFS